MKDVKELEKETTLEELEKAMMLADEEAQEFLYMFTDSDATTDDEEFKLLLESLLKLRECRRRYSNQLYDLNN